MGLLAAMRGLGAAAAGGCLLGILALSWLLYQRPSVQTAAPQAAQSSSAPSDERSIPDLVADLIDSDDPSCPKPNSLSYEACLLFQSALGLWHVFDFPKDCPATLPLPERGGPLRPVIPSQRKLRAADARSALASPCFRTIYTVLVANTVPILSSTALRTFMISIDRPFIEPGTDPNICVEVRHGICGNQAAVGTALFELAGIKSRTVQFFYQSAGARSSHVVVEVSIDGKWRLVDTTYGAVWDAQPSGGRSFELATTDRLIVDERLRGSPIFNRALMPYLVYRAGYNLKPFEYLNAGADVVRDGAGAVKIDLVGDNGVEQFAHLPNYIGDPVPNRPFNGLQLDLEPREKVRPIQLAIDISGSSIGGPGPAWICLDSDCRPIDDQTTKVMFNAINPDRLYIKTENDVSFLVLRSIEWQVARAN